LVRRDYDRALEEFNMAKSELHNDADLLEATALVLMRQGKFLEAQEHYRKAIDFDPLNAIRYIDLSNCLIFTNSWDEADRAINRAAALKPNNAWIYSQKLSLYLNKYGEWEKIEPIVREALANTDTLEFISHNFWLLNLLPELPTGSLIERYRSQKSNSMDLYEHYQNAALAYYTIGDSTMAMLYVDSTRIILEKQLKDNPDQPHRVSSLGLSLALLGDCERAIELGQEGKELLSVDDCHW
jgi:tetratricopeptide (TPR) repeat protein